MSAKIVRKGLSMLAAVVGDSLHEHPADDRLQMNGFHPRLPKNQRKFANRQLNGGEQAHDAQPRLVGQCPQGRFDPHGAII